MRVLVVSAWEPWRRGDGATLILHAHLRELAERHDVTLLCAGAPRREMPVPPGAVTVPARWLGRRLPAPLDALARRLAPGGEPAHVGYVARPELLDALAEAVARDRPDVVHLFGWGTAGLHRRLGGLPAVHDAVDPWAANLANRRRPFPLGLTDLGQASRVRAHEATHYPQLAAVVLRTEQDADLLRRQVPGARIRVVPNGVDPGAAPTELSDEPVLAFLGAYDAAANVEAARRLVTDVLPLVRRQRPDARVLLIGRDPPRGLARLDAEVTGTVPEVRPQLARAGLFIAPMASGHGVKNKVLEAMAAGLPIAGTSLALQGITPSLGVVCADDPQALSAAALRWLDDPAARAAAGRDNRARAVQEFSWAASAARLEAVWQEAVRRCALPS